MKIQIKSDLHKETRPHQFRANNPKHKSIMSPDADVLVLAGDITNYPQRFSLHYELMQLDKPVIYVPGNHEYYMCDLANNVVPEIRAMYEDTHIHVLDRDFINVDGIMFIGATLWSDLSNPHDALAARGFLNDFRMPGLTTDWYNEQHQRSAKFLEDALKLHAPTMPKRVVVTHHGPSTLSSHERYKGSSMNCCFHTDLSRLMQEDWSPQLWIHGHTHDPFDYQLGNTRIVCNPKGYPGERHETVNWNPESPELLYNDDLIIEI